MKAIISSAVLKIEGIALNHPSPDLYPQKCTFTFQGESYEIEVKFHQVESRRISRDSDRFEFWANGVGFAKIEVEGGKS